MEIKQMILTKNSYSYPGTNLKGVKGIVIHWYANPNSSALANRNFFENRKYGKSSYGSAHYLNGLNGELIQAIPDEKMAYHVGSHVYTSRALLELGSYPNNCTIGIENAHVDWEGTMTDETYNSLVELSVHLLKKHNLDERHLWLHQEVVGWKDCHRFFVRHQDEWKKFKELVAERLHGKKVEVDVHTVDINDVEHVEVLGIGDRGNVVKDLQHKLNLLGANPELVEDGVFGKLTQDCVEWFQSKSKIVVDGLVGNQTKKAIEKALKEKNKPKTKPKFNVLSKGDEGKDVEDLQRKLNEKGFNAGKVDGDFGELTQAALIRMQKATGINVDGIYGQQSAKALENYRKPQPKANVPYPGLIKFGDRGKNVQRIQRIVGVKNDGIFGYNTLQAVKEYQRKHGLIVDGIVGIMSHNSMFN